MPRTRFNFSLPADLMERFRKLVPAGKMSRLVERLLRVEVEKLEKKK